MLINKLFQLLIFVAGPPSFFGACLAVCVLVSRYSLSILDDCLQQILLLVRPLPTLLIVDFASEILRGELSDVLIQGLELLRGLEDHVIINVIILL